MCSIKMDVCRVEMKWKVCSLRPFWPERLKGQIIC